MDWGLILGSGGLLGVGYLIFKIGRFTQKMDTFIASTEKNFLGVKEAFTVVHSKITKIDEKLHSIDVRLAVLEAENIFYNCIPEPNTRSEAAKEMWKRKKQKKLELQEGART